MAIDFDGLVNANVEDVFGEPVAYSPSNRLVAPSQPLTAVFDRHHEIVLDDIAKSETSAPGHSTTAPVLTVRLSRFATAPRQNDEVTARGETFVVWDVQPDGRGMADLILREKV